MQKSKEHVGTSPELTLPSLPEQVVVPIRTKNQEILRQFESQKSRPHVVLILERSAVLPSLAVTESIASKYPDTKLVRLAVGKVLPYMFAEHKMNLDDDFDEVDLDLSDPRQAAEFKVWLNNSDDPTVKTLLTAIRKLRLRGRNILVLDDARASGETVNSTLPLLLEAAYVRPVDFENEVFFEGNFSWEQSVVDELGIHLSPAEAKLMSTVLKGSFDLRRFKIELESGFYDTYVKHRRHLRQMRQIIHRKYVADSSGIVPVDSTIILKMAGYQSLLQLRSTGKSSEVKNPAYKLLSEYGMDALIKLYYQAQQKFSSIS